MASDWEKSEGATDAWQPKKKGDEITGLLTDVKDDVGQYNSTLYTLERKKDNKEISVWGSTVLDSRMRKVKLGQEVRIVYEGKGEATGGKNPPKLFEVYYRDPATGDYDLDF